MVLKGREGRGRRPIVGGRMWRGSKHVKSAGVFLWITYKKIESVTDINNSRPNFSVINKYLF